MKKIINLLRAWFRGEEIEAEISVPVPILLLTIAIIIFVVLKTCTYGQK